jgi:malonate decarboxylase alpha subunit
LAEGKMQVGAIHTYIEPSRRLFVDLLPRVALVAAADAADRDGNLYTGTPTAYAWVACLSTNWHSA